MKKTVTITRSEDRLMHWMGVIVRGTITLYATACAIGACYEYAHGKTADAIFISLLAILAVLLRNR